MSVSGEVESTLEITETRIVGVDAALDIGPDLTMTLRIANGTGAGQANKVYQATRTFGGSPDDLDLAGGVTDPLGNTITLTSAIAVLIENLSTANTLTIGDAASNPITSLLNADGTITLRPATATGASWVLLVAPDATGWAIAAGSADVLRVSGTSGQQYRIVVVGRG